MRDDDIPAVSEIEKISFSTPRSEQSFLDEICKKNAFLKVAVFDKSIIAYICTNYLHHESHILDIAVHPDFRRLGVATILMEEARKELKKKGCVFMYLKVRISNTGAQKFYEHSGFRFETIRKKYYDNPEEDALLMMGRL